MKGTGSLNPKWLLISLGCLAYWTATSSLRPLVPLQISSLGGSTTDVAIAVTLQSLAPLIAATFVGRWVDSVGVKIVLVCGATLMSITGILYTLSDNLQQIFALQATNGLAELAVWVSLQAYITQIDEPVRRHHNIAIFSVFWGLGLTFGPWLGGMLFESFGFSSLGYVYAGGGVITLISTILGPCTEETKNTVKSTSDSSLATDNGAHRYQGIELERASGYLLTGMGAFFNSLRQSYFPVLLDERGVSPSRIGLILALMGLSSLLIRIPLPAISRRVGVSPTMVAGTYGCMTLIAFAPFLGTGAALVGSVVVMGALYGVNPPLTMEFLSSRSLASQRGNVMAKRVISNRVAGLVQPLAFAVAANSLGLVVAFPIVGLSVVATGLVTQSVIRRQQTR